MKYYLLKILFRISHLLYKGCIVDEDNKYYKKDAILVISRLFC